MGVGVEIFILLRVVILLRLYLLVLLLVVSDALEAHFPLLEVVGDRLVFNTLNAHELACLGGLALPCSQDDLHVEELVATAHTLELNSLDVRNPEVDDRLGDKDHALLQEVQPAVLGLQATLYIGSAVGRFKVSSWDDKIDDHNAAQ